MIQAALYRYPLYIIILGGAAAYFGITFYNQQSGTGSKSSQSAVRLYALADGWTGYDKKRASEFSNLLANYSLERSIEERNRSTGTDPKEMTAEQRLAARRNAERKSEIIRSIHDVSKTSDNPVKEVVALVRQYEPSLTAEETRSLLRQALSQAEDNYRVAAEITDITNDIEVLLYEGKTGEAESRVRTLADLRRRTQRIRSPNTDAEKRDYRLFELITFLRPHMSYDSSVRLIIRNLEFVQPDGFGSYSETTASRFINAIIDLQSRARQPSPIVAAERSAKVPLFTAEPAFPTPYYSKDLKAADGRPASPEQIEENAKRGLRLVINIIISALYLDCENEYRSVYEKYMTSFFEQYDMLAERGPSEPPIDLSDARNPSARLDAALLMIRRGGPFTAEERSWLRATAQKVLGTSCPNDAGSYRFSNAYFR
jgi:hypothetical protein